MIFDSIGSYKISYNNNTTNDARVCFHSAVRRVDPYLAVLPQRVADRVWYGRRHGSLVPVQEAPLSEGGRRHHQDRVG